MARSCCREALALLGFAAIAAGSACAGKDPYRPGDSIGVFRVTAKLVSTTCGTTPDPWQFDVRLRHDKSTLYWVQGDAPISALVDAAGHATLKAKATQTVRAADARAQMAACVLERDDVVDLTLAPMAAPFDLQPVTSFGGTLTYHFAPSDGAECDDQRVASGGGYAALPCDVRYSVTGSRSGDVN